MDVVASLYYKIYDTAASDALQFLQHAHQLLDTWQTNRRPVLVE